MVKINENFLKLPGGYLFPEIGRRVRAFSAENPPMPLIRLGIGDVTQPLAPAVVTAMEETPAELTQWEESTIRQLVDTVKVLSKDRVLVCLRCGVQIEQKIEE